MDVISSCAYGIKIDSINNPDHPIVQNAQKIFSLDVNLAMIIAVLFPRIAKWLDINFVDKDAIKVLARIINEVKLKRGSENVTGCRNIYFPI